MTLTLKFRCAWSGADDTRAALEEVRDRIAQPLPASVFVRRNPKSEPDPVAREILGHFDCPAFTRGKSG